MSAEAYDKTHTQTTSCYSSHSLARVCFLSQALIKDSTIEDMTIFLSTTHEDWSKIFRPHAEDFSNQQRRRRGSTAGIYIHVNILLVDYIIHIYICIYIYIYIYV